MQPATDKTAPTDTAATDRSMRNHILAGMFVMFGLLGGATAWSAMAEISGAVIAPGVIAVESSAKKVQHQEGGIVAELKVRDGDRVQAGDILVRLDDTMTRANLGIVSKALDEFTALEARLQAERDGSAEIAFPEALVKRSLTNADARASMAGQKSIFDSRRTSRETAKTQLGEQIAQLGSAAEGLSAQRAAREQELILIGEELKGLRDLFSRNLVPITRVTAMERDRTRIEGERGKLIADIAASRGQIAEKRIQIARLDDDFRSDVAKELADVRNKINENVERKIAAEDRLSRVDIRAPVSGMIHQLNIFTVGGVIGNGEAVMLIVPESDKLIVDAQVEPHDIEHLHIGMKANVRFPAFSDRNIKDVVGDIIVISPDLVEDPATRRRFYRVKLAVDAPAASTGVGVHRLVPGMPVEAYITKADRTVLAYLIKPMMDQMQRVFRE